MSRNHPAPIVVLRDTCIAHARPVLVSIPEGGGDGVIRKCAAGDGGWSKNIT
jgi:hypothetical protein